MKFEKYLMDEKKVSTNTLMSYMRDVKKFNEYLCACKISKISAVDCESISAYLNLLRDDGKSESTLTRCVASLRCFFHYLIYIGMIENDPTKGIVTVKTQRKLPQILTSAEVDLLLRQPEAGTLKGY
ncbi:MAG: site-specific integrase, partial [Clostridia bacterium]